MAEKAEPPSKRDPVSFGKWEFASWAKEQGADVNFKDYYFRAERTEVIGAMFAVAAVYGGDVRLLIDSGAICWCRRQRWHAKRHVPSARSAGCSCKGWNYVYGRNCALWKTSHRPLSQRPLSGYPALSIRLGGMRAPPLLWPLCPQPLPVPLYYQRTGDVILPHLPR